MAKKRGRRRGARGNRSQEQAHRASASSSNKTKGSSATRTKATDLKYNPKHWEAHKYIITNHFGDSMCGTVLNGDLQAPEIDPGLATALLTDMSRGGTPPNPPLLDSAYWACTSEQELGDLALERDGESAFDAFITAKQSTKKAKPAKKGGKATVKQEDGQQSEEEDDDEQQTSQEFVTACRQAWAALETYRTQLAEFRAENPVVDFIKHQKLVSQINNSLDSATGVYEFDIFPIHIRYKIYAELNTKIYSFLNKFIGRDYKYLKQGISHNDGLALYQRCNIKQSKPSPVSGQAVLAKIIAAKQQAGQEYSAYAQYIQDLCNDYEEATGGLTVDEPLRRLALTQRIIDFYKPVMDSIRTNDLTQGHITPLRGEGSILEAMTRYEIDHQKEFRQLRKKKPRNSKEDRDKREQANAAQSQGKKTFTCTWCAEFRPGEPTSHKVQDCRIKKAFLSTTCDVCGQKGHPSRYCQSGKPGRANQADEDSKSIASTRSRRSTTLKRYVERADDELNAAEAMKALKAAHKRNKKKGKKSLFTITRVDLSSSDSE
jgi:hypothetical protein